MQETPITSKNLITEEGCPANQDLGNSQFDPSHKIHPRRLLYKPRHFEHRVVNPHFANSQLTRYSSQRSQLFNSVQFISCYSPLQLQPVLLQVQLRVPLRKFKESSRHQTVSCNIKSNRSAKHPRTLQRLLLSIRELTPSSVFLLISSYLLNYPSTYTVDGVSFLLTKQPVILHGGRHILLFT